MSTLKFVLDYPKEGINAPPMVQVISYSNDTPMVVYNPYTGKKLCQVMDRRIFRLDIECIGRVNDFYLAGYQLSEAVGTFKYLG